jgi:hypothetical protein
VSNGDAVLDKLQRVLFNRYTALLLGLAFLGFSIMVWANDADPSDNVYCDGELMRPGDTCIHTDYENPESNRTNSLEEERAEQLRNSEGADTFFGIACPILSVLTIGGSVFFMVRRVRRSRSPALPAGG